MASKLDNVLRDQYISHFPSKTVTYRETDKPWMNNTIRISMKQRQKAYIEGDMEKYKELKNNVSTEIKKAKQGFYDKNINDLKNSEPGKWHRHIKSITSNTSN